MNAVFNGPNKPTGVSNVRIEGYGGGGDATLGSPTSESYGGRSSAANNYGYGEGTFSAGDSATVSLGSGGSKMVGFGNPQYNNSKGRSSPTFIEKMKAKISGDGPAGGQTGPYKNYDRPGSSFQPPPIASIDATRKRGEVGGVWANDDGASGGGGSFTSSRPPVASNGGGAYTTHAPTPVRPTSSNGEYETRLIDSLTPAAGVRTQPSKEELLKFSNQCESLDKLLVVRIINDTKLGSDVHPTTQMKGMCLIESILTTGDVRSTEEVEDYLCENSNHLEYLETNGANQPLRMKAIRIMELCGLREEKKPVQSTPTPTTQAANSAFYQQPQQQQPQVDLLGFASPPAVAASAASSPAESSAFGFLESTPSQQQSAPSSSNGDNLFGSMEIRAPQGQSSSTAPSGSTDVFDLFGGSTTSPTPAAPAAAAASNNPTSASNSFDFLNSTSPSTTPASSAGKVDPLTLLMSTAKISTQPRAPMPMQTQQGTVPFGANGMAGFPPRQNMPPLGPTGYPQGPYGYPGQPGAYPPHGYPGGPYGQPGYPPQGQVGFPGAGFGGVNPAAAAANSNALFQVKAAGSGAQPIGIRPSIDLDPLGNPILLGPIASSNSTSSSGLNASSSAFGFVGNGGDTFGFVDDMMKK